MNGVNWTPLVGAVVLTKARLGCDSPGFSTTRSCQAAEEAGRKLQAAGRVENEQAIATMKAKWQLEVHRADAGTRGGMARVRGKRLSEDPRAHWCRLTCSTRQNGSSTSTGRVVVRM